MYTQSARSAKGSNTSEMNFWKAHTMSLEELVWFLLRPPDADAGAVFFDRNMTLVSSDKQ